MAVLSSSLSVCKMPRGARQRMADGDFNVAARQSVMWLAWNGYRWHCASSHVRLKRFLLTLFYVSSASRIAGNVDDTISCFRDVSVGMTTRHPHIMSQPKRKADSGLFSACALVFARRIPNFVRLRTHGRWTVTEQKGRIGE